MASYIFDTIRGGREGTPGSSQISVTPAGNFDVDLCRCVLFPSRVKLIIRLRFRLCLAVPDFLRAVVGFFGKYL